MSSSKSHLTKRPQPSNTGIYGSIKRILTGLVSPSASQAGIPKRSRLDVDSTPLFSGKGEPFNAKKRIIQPFKPEDSPKSDFSDDDDDDDNNEAAPTQTHVEAPKSKKTKKEKKKQNQKKESQQKNGSHSQKHNKSESEAEKPVDFNAALKKKIEEGISAAEFNKTVKSLSKAVFDVPAPVSIRLGARGEPVYYTPAPYAAGYGTPHPTTARTRARNSSSSRTPRGATSVRKPSRRSVERNNISHLTSTPRLERNYRRYDDTERRIDQEAVRGNTEEPPRKKQRRFSDAANLYTSNTVSNILDAMEEILIPATAESKATEQEKTKQLVGLLKSTLDQLEGRNKYNKRETRPVSPTRTPSPSRKRARLASPQASPPINTNTTNTTSKTYQFEKPASIPSPKRATSPSTTSKRVSTPEVHDRPASPKKSSTGGFSFGNDTFDAADDNDDSEGESAGSNLFNFPSGTSNTKRDQLERSDTIPTADAASPVGFSLFKPGGTKPATKEQTNITKEPASTKNQQQQQTSFSFDMTSKPAAKESTGFSFDTISKPAAKESTGFSFDATAKPATKESTAKEPAGFSFDSPAKSTTKEPAGSGFSFDALTKNSKESTGFSFNSTVKDPAPTAAATGFSFDTSSSKTAAPASGFSFQTSDAKQPAKQEFSFGLDTNSTTKKDDAIAPAAFAGGFSFGVDKKDSASTETKGFSFEGFGAPKKDTEPASTTAASTGMSFSFGVPKATAPTGPLLLDAPKKEDSSNNKPNETDKGEQKSSGFSFTAPATTGLNFGFNSSTTAKDSSTNTNSHISSVDKPTDTLKLNFGFGANTAKPESSLFDAPAGNFSFSSSTANKKTESEPKGFSFGLSDPSNAVVQFGTNPANTTAAPFGFSNAPNSVNTGGFSFAAPATNNFSFQSKPESVQSTAPPAFGAFPQVQGTNPTGFGVFSQSAQATTVLPDLSGSFGSTPATPSKTTGGRRKKRFDIA